MFDYHGRVAVITGGSSGLGVLCANALAARGCDIVLAARRFEILEENAQALREQYGVKAIPVRCDVTKEDQVIAARELVEKEFGRCDILINCAGEGHNDWAIDLALEKWQATIDVCVTGLFLMCREFGKLMREHNYGRIVNVASMLGMIALDSSFGRGISEYLRAQLSISPDNWPTSGRNTASRSTPSVPASLLPNSRLSVRAGLRISSTPGAR